MSVPQNGQTHSNNLSAKSRRIVWVYLAILWGWRLKSYDLNREIIYRKLSLSLALKAIAVKVGIVVNIPSQLDLRSRNSDIGLFQVNFVESFASLKYVANILRTKEKK